MKTKIAIGTAQFGLDYGISNSVGEVDLKEVKNILNFIRCNVSNPLIDTAKGYGKSEIKLGEAGVKDFNIVTKISTLKNVDADIIDSYNKLNIKTLYAVLMHDFRSFVKNKNQYNNFYNSKKTHKVKKIGFSLNKESELEYLLNKKIKFDILQVPYNILDQRFGKYFKMLHDLGVEIHIRSVFLQGLFFLKSEEVPVGIKKLLPNLNLIKDLAKTNNFSIHNLALNFVANNKFVDKIIIGVSSLNELKNNYEAFSNTKNFNAIYPKLINLAVNDEQLVLPMNWNKDE